MSLLGRFLKRHDIQSTVPKGTSKKRKKAGDEKAKWKLLKIVTL